jgi:hypothetical protein
MEQTLYIKKKYLSYIFFVFKIMDVNILCIMLFALLLNQMKKMTTIN